MQKPANKKSGGEQIIVTVSDSIHYSGSGTECISATLPQLIEILNGVKNIPAADATGIDYWLQYDKWTQEEGLMLVMGLDPRETIVSTSHWINAKGERLEGFRRAGYLNGKVVDFETWLAIYDHLKDIGAEGINDALAVKAEMYELGERYREMKKLWESGSHPTLNTPAFFVGWAISKGLNIPPRLAALAKETQTAPKQGSVPVVTSALVTKNKLRRNSLDPAIDKATKQAGSMELAAVYLELKTLALGEEKPFTGALDSNALCYTDDNNQPAKLTKDALGKRLKKRR